ncbi:MAG TPA: hypothetical protein VES39_00900 [Rhodospirillales bacterium]|nr:hypothetical protein [Rhodospirillales bacterium]
MLPFTALGRNQRAQETNELLRPNIGMAERAVIRLIAVPLTDGQFDALAPFVFNVCAGGLQRSTPAPQG